MPLRATALVALLLLVACAESPPGRPPVRQPRSLDEALVEAGDNRPELERALTSVSGERQEALRFLYAHMPSTDITTLDADFLIENVNYAFRAWKETPWGRETSKDVFFRQVLPYAVASEDRDPWRKRLFEELMPFVADCDTSLEAVQTLNEKVWEHFNVTYELRPRPDQNLQQSIAAGKASCTGITIFMVTCTRAIGVPSRLVAVAEWPHKRGNHSWVESYDDDGWHVISAWMPEDYIDDNWVQDDAIHALRDVPEHAFYAVSFACTDAWLPAFWARHVDLHGENVTDRYHAYAHERSRWR